MGGGSWSAATYNTVTSAKVASGTTFGYDTYAKRTGTRQAHESLDPKKLNSRGENIRESLDSDEHPNSTPMVVAFDQTGSMGYVPRDMQTSLKTLFQLTVDKGMPDVQIAIGAYGDARNGEYVPLQISQFESDNRIDDALDNLYLEGNGGGNGGETSNLLFYYLAHHTRLDSLDKRGIKGKLYVIADEKQLPINADHIQKYIGEEPLGDLSFEGIVADLTEKFDVTILLIDNASARYQGSEKFYSDLLGPNNVVIVEDVKTIPEMIAAMFAMDMGRSIDDVSTDLATVVGKDVALRITDAIATRKGTRNVALR